MPHGVQILETEDHQLVLDYGFRLLRTRGTMLVWGPYGTGKTVALYALVECLGDQGFYIRLADRAAGHEVAVALYRELTGTDTSARGMKLLLKLRDEIIGERAFVLVIDEAYLMNRTALRHLRWLHDHKVNWGLVLGAIAPAALEKLTPEFDTRASLRVEFSVLGADWLDWIERYHALFKTAPPEFLYSINAEYAEHVLRRWENVLLVAQTYMEDAGVTTITEEVAAATLGALTGSWR
ncbi:MAG TPA: ATP-binding protein [Candidatus Limnocylindrales bacterium]